MSTRLEQVLALHCSPELFGIKAANLISCSLDECPNLFEDINELNKKHNPKICFRILKSTGNRCLILIYKHDKLAKTIFKNDVYEYLVMHGYPNVKKLDLYLDFLQRKITADGNFPHEIGVFLGYDLSDTIEFENGNKDCIYVGYWKVYSKKEEKLQIFERYNKCRDIVFSLLNKGYRLEALI